MNVCVDEFTFEYACRLVSAKSGVGYIYIYIYIYMYIYIVAAGVTLSCITRLSVGRNITQLSAKADYCVRILADTCI